MDEIPDKDELLRQLGKWPEESDEDFLRRSTAEAREALFLRFSAFLDGEGESQIGTLPLVNEQFREEIENGHAACIHLKALFLSQIMASYAKKFYALEEREAIIEALDNGDIEEFKFDVISLQDLVDPRMN